MKMAFNDSTPPTVTVETPNEETRDKAEVSNALVPASAQPLTNYVEDDDYEGESAGKYATHPWLKLTTPSSNADVLKKFGPGAWVLGGEDKLGDENTVIPLTVIKAGMAWQENMAYTPGVTKQTFRTAAEAQAAGFSTDWNARKAGRPSVSEVLSTLLWMPKPEGLDDLPHVFCYDGPDGPGALLRFFAASTTFSTFAKPILDAKAKFLRKEKGGLAAGRWELYTTQEHSKNGLPYRAARMKPATPLYNSPELAAFLRTVSL